MCFRKFSTVAFIASVETKAIGSSGSTSRITSALKPRERRKSAAALALALGSLTTKPMLAAGEPSFSDTSADGKLIIVPSHMIVRFTPPVFAWNLSATPCKASSSTIAFLPSSDAAEKIREPRSETEAGYVRTQAGRPSRRTRSIRHPPRPAPKLVRTFQISCDEAC